MTPLRTIRVLLVEDEPGDAELVRIALRAERSAHFDLDWVCMLGEARQRISQCRFDLVVLDLSLPDSAGLDTVRAVRRLVDSLPIIVLTGQDDLDFALAAQENGANDYMVKGDFGHAGLVRAIRYALHRNEMEVRNKLLATALEASPCGIVVTDSDARIEWANPAFCRLTGYAMEEIQNKKPAELVKSGVQDAGYYDEMWQTILAGRHWRGELVNKRKDGSLYNEELTIAPVLDGFGKIRHFIGIKQDISKRKRLEEELKQLAVSDPLTGLPNRRAFMERLVQELARLKRFDCVPATLLMLDLDHFKQINDAYGHATGDDVLCYFAGILKSELRQIDLSGRLGGEEFAILLTGADREEAHTLAARLRQRLADFPFQHPEGPIYITVSIGGSALSREDKDHNAVLLRADTALYQAKSNGRDQFKWFHLVE